ncbi:DNA ligase D [Rhizobium leucaenae]|uniref:DNA ligase (ATP) n=1 Tax=Rhizobium leucaenae TaxID=29450 RepID=A0A7W6ZUE4_9HYPH|nr:DNA ligase D [Rhizobium leucaenae]MBB4568819.1 bifunctional non-homologous end joining protein LigD [Rhizobium leucaenae]MBB6302104.1 bifunctional non-homologous end joining protein LigD [Rhizobium leucaenae]
MALETYREKRDFSKTSEPRGRTRKSAGHNSFVIQKHAARRLHYDFRLELDGVLKSWAVAKGPSLVPSDKRLAVQVEDHPLDYGDFEGTIPKGEYGGGSVIVWDRGTWEPDGDPHKGLTKGHIELELHGEKLHGRWHLIRMARRAREKKDNWLLIKGDDEAARPEGADDILEERPESVKTGRLIEELEGEKPGWSSKTGKIEQPTAKRKQTQRPAMKTAADPSSAKKAKKMALPDFVPPTLATLTKKPPSGKQWLHEIKFDGYRVQARIEDGRVKLLTRSGLDWSDKFGKTLLTELAHLPVKTMLADGELVVETGSGASDFSALQADLSDGRNDRFVLYVFDLLYLDGYDLRDAPLVERKKILEKIIPSGNGKLRFSSDFDADGDLMLEHACRLSLEGIVSKRADEPYRSGRGKGWLKSKCSFRQEFVIAGYVPSSTARKAIGSLVLGIYDKDKLQHVGRVGTGFTNKVAEALYSQLEGMRADESPFDKRLNAEEARGVRFVRPELVAEIEFRTWTGDGLLRHAAFRGLREDKPATEIVRETSANTATEAELPKRTVVLTHADRIYWPDEGVTKEGLADYYTDVWKYMAPFVVQRPLALLRCPDGVNGQSFFQKHAWKGLNKNIVLIHDPKEKDEGPLVSIDDLDGLLGLVQAGSLELHPWGITIADWEHPDMIIMDLDPGPGVPWERVIEAAEETRDRMKEAGLAAFIKTSGGKGLHVVSPLKPKADWPAVKAFTKSVADQMAADSPERYVSTITKSKRQGKILVDYLRNQRGSTAVAPYSTRARPGAAVSMPLAWEELSPAIGPAYFTVNNTPNRLAALRSDPWEDFRAAAAPLEQLKSKKGRVR